MMEVPDGWRRPHPKQPLGGPDGPRTRRHGSSGLKSTTGASRGACSARNGARRTAFGVFSTSLALYRRYPPSGSASYLPTRAAPLALAHKSYLPTPGVGEGGGNPADSCRQPRRASAARLPGSSRQPAAAHLEARERLPGTCVAAKDKRRPPRHQYVAVSVGFHTPPSLSQRRTIFSYLPTHLPSTAPAARTYLPTIWHLRYRAT